MVSNNYVLKAQVPHPLRSRKGNITCKSTFSFSKKRSIAGILFQNDCEIALAGA